MAQSTQVSWQVLLDEADWESESALELPPTVPDEEFRVARSRRAWWLMAGAVLLCALVWSLHLWRQAQAGLAQVEADITQSLVLDGQAQQAGDDLLAEALLDDQSDANWRRRVLAEAQRAGGAGPTAAEILSMDLHGDRAVARVLVTDARSPMPYRQVRFYRETERGWLRTQPDLSFWGSRETLESEAFTFYFRQRDRAAVAEAAPVLDALDRKMRDQLGLLTPVARTVVFVLGGGDSVGDAWQGGEMPWRVQSPLLVPLPDQVTDARFLVESVAYSLRRQLVLSDVAAATSTIDFAPTPWLLSGLRLWLAWENGSALTGHTAELVHWLYADAPGGPRGLPESQPEICQALDVWAFDPGGISLHLRCSGLIAPMPSAVPPATGLGQLPLIMNLNALSYDRSMDAVTGAVLEQRQGRVLAMATVLAYATQTYGSEVVSRLLLTVKKGQRWPEAAPAVFGVSADDFEAGWWVYLAQEYGVDTENFVP